MFAEYLDGLRDFAEWRMEESSECAVMRATAGATQDEATGLVSPTWATAYLGPFRLGGANGGSSGTRTIDIGGAELQLAVRTGHFPVAADLRDGDLIEVTAGENTGTVWRVVEGDWADQQTARRVPLIAVERPEEWS